MGKPQTSDPWARWGRSTASGTLLLELLASRMPCNPTSLREGKCPGGKTPWLMNKDTRPGFRLGVCQCDFLSTPHIFPSTPHHAVVGDDWEMIAQLWHFRRGTGTETEKLSRCYPVKGRMREWKGTLTLSHPGLTIQPSPYSYTFVSRRPQIILGCHKTVQLLCMAWGR